MVVSVHKNLCSLTSPSRYLRLGVKKSSFAVKYTKTTCNDRREGGQLKILSLGHEFFRHKKGEREKFEKKNVALLVLYNQALFFVQILCVFLKPVVQFRNLVVIHAVTNAKDNHK